MLINDERLFAMSHAGRGVNCYGLNLVTAQGPVAVFLQQSYGGLYPDGRARSSRAVNARRA
jgi:hypothetical protein